MLNADQRAYFDAFGFIVLRTLFSREEMDRIIAASEGLWAGELNAGTDSTRYQTFANFVERSPDLMWLIDDDRTVRRGHRSARRADRLGQLRRQHEAWPTWATAFPGMPTAPATTS